MTPGGQAQIGNVDLVKQLNSAAVYRLIDQYGPISRIQIAEQSQLAPASVTKITRQLIERGLIKEVDQQASTGGRRAISIVTETRNFHAIGVRLGRHDATITLFDLSSKVLAEEHYPLPERTQQTLEHALLNAIAQFIDSYQRKLRELIAISVILPGLVDPDSGKIHYMPHIQVENWGLVEALEERFKVTCFVGHDIRSLAFFFMPHIQVENWGLVEALEERFKVTCFVGHDIRSLALAEHYFGASQDCEDSILVRVHRGTGAGIISNGRIFIGRNGNVGEIGHIQVEPLGERCHCGNFGCLETIAANAAIEQRVLNLLKQGYQSRVPLDDCTIKTICKAANKGDSLASEVIEYVGRHLGKTIAIAINLFNPQKIVIAGEITEADKVLLPAIESCINTQALKAFRTNLPVVRSELDHRSAIGAFALVKRAMLNGILLQHLLEN
ncbi:DNA-binding transcriptional dual regulator [Escherichia coli SHECO001]|nr:N-acetylglucosamine repressor [Escherichia coli]OSK03860.1 DNA-binding transcriptional dual regulator [Escherichia coli SHECO001]